MATMGNNGLQDALETAKQKIRSCESPGEFRNLFIQAVQDKDKALVSCALVVLDKLLQSSPMTEEEEAEAARLNKMVSTLKTIKAPQLIIDQKLEDGLMVFVGAINRMETFWYVQENN